MTALGGDLGLQLVVVNGPLEGETFSVDGPVIIGRSRPGIVLPDHTVSIKHARIEPHGDALRLVDLGSKTGTRLNGRELEAEKPEPVDLGDRIAIGETEFRVDSVANRVFGRALWLMVPAWALVVAALVVLYVASGARPLVLEFSEPVQVPRSTTSLEVPPAFARTHGLSLDRITLLDVRDDDRDGIDEIWLGKDERELVVTFDEQGTWRSRGEVPSGCTPRFADGVPQVDCGGTLYQLLQDRYVPVLQEGVVVFLSGKARGGVKAPAEAAGKKAKKKKKSKEGGDEEPKGKKAKNGAREDGLLDVPLARGLNGPESLVAYRVQLDRPSILSGFLSERGVHGPVHYILCEDQGLGHPAQVRLADGSFQPLTGGCGDALSLDGLQADAFDGARVVGVAVNATGWNLLPRDLSITTTGASDDRMATEAQRRQLDAWSVLPRSAISYTLTARAIEQGFSPVAPEDHQLEPARMESPLRQRLAIGGSLLNRGIAELTAGSCTYRVRTEHFRCALIRGCLPGSTFVSVVEKGCGDARTVINVGYGDGITRRETEHAWVQVEVQAGSAAGVTDVSRAVIAVRPKAER